MGFKLASCLCGGGSSNRTKSPQHEPPYDISSIKSSDPSQSSRTKPPPPLPTAYEKDQNRLSSSSVSKLASNISMKVKAAAGMEEESVWKKTIILGEKCRVPDDDDGIAVCDENGNGIPIYHRKVRTAGSISLSRQSSCADMHQGSEPPRLGD